ncbi:MAG TPA: PAS domain-containing protein [Bradyrhizobium sp.]|nr:PAS domain-containing protein [Bradyrhizobium sp.]
MKHPSNRELFEYWNQRRGDRLAPERGEIEPGAIRQVLGDTFVIEVNALDNHVFRLAGTRLCALFGRELKTESFNKLWQRSGQTAIRELLSVVMEEKVGIVATVTGATSDDTLAPVQLEMLLLPLAYQSRGEARLMGALAPMAAPYWLGAKAVGPLTLGMFRHIGAAADAAVPRFRAAAGRLRHGLTVYDGGRAGRSPGR